MALAATFERPVDLRLRGIGLVLLTMMLFAGLDATAKQLGSSLPAMEVAWFRYAINVVCVVVVLRAWRQPELFGTRRPLLQVLRGLFLMGSTVFNFAALHYLQLVETASIQFAGPLIVTALAGPLLGEQIGWRRWMAVVVGLFGVLVVIRPGLGGMHWAALLSLTSTLCYALYLIMTRHLGRTESAEGMLLLSAVVGMVALTPMMPPIWHMPSSLEVWIMLAALGVFGGVGHFMLIHAHKYAPASALAPFSYTQILWMTTLGFVVFDDLPDMWTVVGGAIIVGSGLYTLHRERLRRRG